MTKREALMEARRRVSRPLKTGGGNLGWGIIVRWPADGGPSRICDCGSYRDAVAARAETLRRMAATLAEER